MGERRLERGQALVLIVLAIVAMFGFAALAVDFGRLYAERRRVQSAADAAALAAAFAASQSNDYQAAALNQLGLNDITDNDPNLNTDKRVDVEIYNPPASGPYGPASGLTTEERKEYYQIIVHSAVDQVFSQFVYRGPLAVTVEAVARLKKASGLADGQVLHAVSDDSCNGLWFHGNGTTTVKGGGAFSDSSKGSSCGGGGTPSCNSGLIDGSGTIILEDGTIGTVGGWDDNGKSGLVDTASPINQCTTKKELPHLPVPDCSNLPHLTYGGGSGTIQPGIYDNGIVVQGGNTDLVLAPGLYCLNGDLSMNGGTVSGMGVFFYMQGGSVSLGGNTLVNLMAAGGTSLKDASGQEWSGFLIYMPAENLGEVKLSGSSSSKYSGTIYAPGPRPQANQDKCVIEGKSGTIGLSANLICYTIKIGGSANINIDYQDSQNWHMPSTIDLMQ